MFITKKAVAKHSCTCPCTCQKTSLWASQWTSSERDRGKGEYYGGVNLRALWFFYYTIKDTKEVRKLVAIHKLYLFKEIGHTITTLQFSDKIFLGSVPGSSLVEGDSCSYWFKSKSVVFFNIPKMYALQHSINI